MLCHTLLGAQKPAPQSFFGRLLWRTDPIAEEHEEPEADGEPDAPQMFVAKDEELEELFD